MLFQCCLFRMFTQQHALIGGSTSKSKILYAITSFERGGLAFKGLFLENIVLQLPTGSELITLLEQELSYQHNPVKLHQSYTSLPEMRLQPMSTLQILNSFQSVHIALAAEHTVLLDPDMVKAMKQCGLCLPLKTSRYAQ